MQLHTIWFIIIAVLWIGFFVLEGFDFGVGALHMLIGRTETERRVVINTIGPWWDGNEVWLIVAGASMFAAFPEWYATMFSALYLALVLLLVALFGRGVSFEYRGKRESERWRNGWSWALTIGSIVIPLLVGVALGDLLHGLPIDSQARVHRELLQPVDRLRADDRGDAGRAVPAARRDVPRAADHRRDPRSGPLGGRSDRRGRDRRQPRVGASGRWS